MNGPNEWTKRSVQLKGIHLYLHKTDNMFLTLGNLRETWTNEFLPNIRKEIQREIRNKLDFLKIKS